MCVCNLRVSLCTQALVTSSSWHGDRAHGQLADCLWLNGQTQQDQHREACSCMALCIQAGMAFLPACGRRVLRAWRLLTSSSSGRAAAGNGQCGDPQTCCPLFPVWRAILQGPPLYAGSGSSESSDEEGWLCAASGRGGSEGSGSRRPSTEAGASPQRGLVRALAAELLGQPTAGERAVARGDGVDVEDGEEQLGRGCGGERGACVSELRGAACCGTRLPGSSCVAAPLAGCRVKGGGGGGRSLPGELRASGQQPLRMTADARKARSVSSSCCSSATSCACGGGECSSAWPGAWLKGGGAAEPVTQRRTSMHLAAQYPTLSTCLTVSAVGLIAYAAQANTETDRGTLLH